MGPATTAAIPSHLRRPERAVKFARSATALGEDVVSLPAPLTESPPADRFCDVVLTGGVASGVVYPWAVLEIAREFRLRHIGGTSVGAMAACLAAAAEYGRRNGHPNAFEVLRRAPGELAECADDPQGRTRMLRLFQPAPQGRRLFGLFVEAVRQVQVRPSEASPSAASPSGRIRALLQAVAGAYRRELLVGALLGALVAVHAAVGIGMALAWLTGVPGGFDAFTAAWSAREWVFGAGALAWMAAAAAAGAVLAVGLALVREVRHGIIGNDLGLCRGGPVEGFDADRDPGLVQWLHDGVQAAAGLGEDDPPLTFGDLWQAPLAPGVEAPRAQREAATDARARSIDLQVITTNVTHGRPYRLPGPDPTSRLFFLKDDVAKFFPPAVVEALVRTAEPYRPKADSDPPVDATNAEFLELPSADLPIVVAARLSLSFPILFSAVPLYAIDYEMRGPRDPKGTGVPRNLKRCWFSDGGICSNFPIHLFDAAIPRWPTFGLWLGRRSPERPDEPVWMPDLPREGWGDHRQRFDPQDRMPVGSLAAGPRGPWSMLLGFIGAIVTSAKDWQDHTAMRMPHVRNRIARLQLVAGEGELNIAMSRADILRMAAEYGTASGRLVCERWAGDPDLAPRRAWREQRWIRLHTLIDGLREFLAGAASGSLHARHAEPIDAAVDAATRGVGDEPPLRDLDRDVSLDAAQARALRRARDAVLELERELARDSTRQPYRPYPRPELRMRPPL